MRSFFIATVLTCVAAQVRADDLADFAAKIDAKLYTPATHGLKDFRAVVVLKDSTMEKEMKGLRIVIYWKAPDRRCVRFEDEHGAKADGASVDFLLNEGKEIIEAAVPVPFAQRKTKAGADVHSVRVSPTPFDVVGEDRVWTFDAEFRPVRSETAGPGDMSHVDAYKCRAEGGVVLIEEIHRSSRTDMGSSEIEIKYDWQRVGAYWFPLKESLQGKPFAELSDIKVDQGVDDAVFDDKK